MDTVKTTASNTTDSLKKFSIANLMPSRVDVVKVREKDLQEMPLGKERALAFDRERKRSLWSFSLPKNFKEPILPNLGEGELDGSLLPPKS